MRGRLTVFQFPLGLHTASHMVDDNLEMCLAGLVSTSLPLVFDCMSNKTRQMKLLFSHLNKHSTALIGYT